MRFDIGRKETTTSAMGYDYYRDEFTFGVLLNPTTVSVKTGQRECKRATITIPIEIKNTLLNYL